MVIRLSIQYFLLMNTFPLSHLSSAGHVDFQRLGSLDENANTFLATHAHHDSYP